MHACTTVWRYMDLHLRMRTHRRNAILSSWLEPLENSWHCGQPLLPVLFGHLLRQRLPILTRPTIEAMSTDEQTHAANTKEDLLPPFICGATCSTGPVDKQLCEFCDIFRICEFCGMFVDCVGQNACKMCGVLAKFEKRTKCIGKLQFCEMLTIVLPNLRNLQISCRGRSCQNRSRTLRHMTLKSVFFHETFVIQSAL